MQDQANPGEGDFVRVASCATPTEAHMLKSMLEANGLMPFVADSNTVQAQPWASQALGGVRVLVPAGQLEQAKRALDEFHAGAFELDDGDETPRAATRPLSTPVFSPDRATVWSFALTPAFGATLQLMNSMAIGDRSARLRDAVWLVLMTGLTAMSVFLLHRIDPGPFVVFRAGVVSSFITVVWYFLAMQPRSKALVEAHGRDYARRPTFMPALATIVIALLVGWGLDELA